MSFHHDKIGAVIGAYAVVRGDIPPYAIAIGNPAKVVKYRFSPELIATLLSAQWWNGTDEEVLQTLLHNNNQMNSERK